MKSIFESVIRKGGYDLNRILQRIDEYHIEGKLTDEERQHLMQAARGDAAPGLDVAAEVQRLWEIVRDLLRRVYALETGTAGDTGADREAEAWKEPTGAHDAYYYGDKIVYNGETYTCIAPEGVACVWSPDVMPDYWQVM